jgi:Trk-type K+ transport system membrane component
MLAAWVRVKRGVSQHRFIFAYTSHLWVLCFVGAAIIQRVDGLSYLHSLFLATSAVYSLKLAPALALATAERPHSTVIMLWWTVTQVTCTGLSVVPMSDLSTGSFVTLTVLMVLGGTVVLLLPPL